MNARVFLATRNLKKQAELRRILAEQGMPIEVVGLSDIEPYPEPTETEWTFEGNALIKARAGAAHTGMATLADDSGLEVDALNNMPGTRSSRWAGPESPDMVNLELVLRQIEDVPDGRRKGRFVAVMALVMPDGREFTTRGEMSGRLTHGPRGSHGFGYDPIFCPDEQDVAEGCKPRTNAQLSPEEKDRISHRGKAVRAIVPVLAQALGLSVQEES